jgi:hypothetical protein
MGENKLDVKDFSFSYFALFDSSISSVCTHSLNETDGITWIPIVDKERQERNGCSIGKDRSSSTFCFRVSFCLYLGRSCAHMA